ncbi:Noc2-domain-containing protein, partial [Conidiobolus coronatus NRRL 28638]
RFDSILVYFASFPKLSRDLVKTLLKLFGSSQDDKVRLLAFITLKNLSKSSKEFLDLSLKGVYMSYIRNAKNVTAFNLPQIEMMRNCGVELYGQDFAASYQHAFQFIRRLATHLRTSLTNKTKDSYQQVYNNQFIHSIYFWSQVLCSYCNANSEQENGESPLKPLIYPFVQVTLGTLSLIPSPKYFPLKFHCIKALIPIMQSTKVYIPVAPYLIEILESSEFQKKPKPSTEKPLNFDVVIKAPKNHLRTKPYQDELSRLVNECFLAYFSCLSTSIAFPEVVLPTTLYLKRFAKKTAPNTPRFVQVLLTKIKETSDMVNQKRDNVKFNPGNLNSLKTFMRDTDVFKTPLGQQYKQIVKVNQSRKRTLQTQNDDE